MFDGVHVQVERQDNFSCRSVFTVVYASMTSWRQ